jgi:hypothetical protein
MNREQLRALFRADSDDLAVPYLFEDAAANAWLAEAEEEAAIRADLLPEYDNLAVCQIATTAGVAGYAVHTAITRITRADFYVGDATEPCQLRLVNRLELDRIRPAWRTETGEPRVLLVEHGKVRLVPTPTDVGVLQLEAMRLPLTPMADDADVPEIQAMHHRHLVQWALHRAYSLPDNETRDPVRAGAALALFESYFGRRPDADEGQAGELSAANKPDL